jgi:hypothetical protein
MSERGETKKKPPGHKCETNGSRSHLQLVMIDDACPGSQAWSRNTPAAPHFSFERNVHFDVAVKDD